MDIETLIARGRWSHQKSWLVAFISWVALLWHMIGPNLMALCASKDTCPFYHNFSSLAVTPEEKLAWKTARVGSSVDIEMMLIWCVSISNLVKI